MAVRGKCVSEIWASRGICVVIYDANMQGFLVRISCCCLIVEEI